MSKVEQYITSIPDYPKAGIIFRDITSVLKDADGLRLAVDEMTAKIGDTEFDAIVGLESRGFLFGMPMHTICTRPLFRSARAASCRARPRASRMTSNTALRRSRCTARTSRRDCAWSSLTI